MLMAPPEVLKSWLEENIHWTSPVQTSRIHTLMVAFRDARKLGECRPRSFLTWLLAWAFMLVPCLHVSNAAAPTLGQALRNKLRSSQPPNIIFVLADDLGYGDLGCYGQKKIKTPNIDRLAAEGMRFTQCYAGSTVCAPSRACLMTGLHTGHARIRGNGPLPLAGEDLTVAELLKQKDYQTGAIGKWGLGAENTTGTPHKQGFDEWLGYLNQKHAHDYYPTFLWRSSTFNNIYDHVLPMEANFEGKKGQYSPDLFSLAATNFIRISRYQPFFLYLPMTIPHAHNALTKKSGNGMEVPSDDPYSQMDWPQPEKNKAAMITRLDKTVGDILDYVRHLNLDTNTVIFFTSDNGPHREGGNNPAFFQSSGPWRGLKRDLYEGGIRVPFIVRWPGHIEPGSVSHQLTALWDFLPTAAELAGLRPPENVDGISILPTLLNQKQTNQHAFLYWEFHERGTQQAVRSQDWKALRLGPEEPLQLYNLSSDPGETNNVAAQHPDVVQTMESYLQSARTESPHWPIQKRTDHSKDKPATASKTPPQD